MHRFIGIPFNDNEPSLSGANCYGLVQLFYRDHLGIVIPSLIHVHSEHSNRVWATYLKEISEHWESVEEPEMFDVVAMAHDMSHPRIVQHVGIYIGEGRVLHTLNKIGSHISKLSELKSIIRGYHRWQN